MLAKLSYRIIAISVAAMAAIMPGVVTTVESAAASATGDTTHRAAAQNLVKNGSFERPAVSSPCHNGGEGNPTPGICTYLGGSTGIPGWTVGSNSVDVTAASVWKAAAGHQSIDLSGDGPGSVKQVITTIKGKRYVLRWAMAGNWDCGQRIKSMVIYWDGAIVKAFNFNTAGHGASSMGWAYHQVTVIATGRRSTMEFADATADQSICGATLDNISLK
jgi:choice-of-anchor C domain-containing protein